jgi:[amino group carrier protein]-L-2-aminoadipate 6-kinase
MLVVKCGGASGVDAGAVCADVAELVRAGETVVLVHGGSAEADALGRRLGVPPRFLTSPSGVRSRHTDPATLDVLTMALTGRVGPALVATLLSHGIRAVGLSGVDGGLLRARRKPAVKAVEAGRTRLVRDDLTGTLVSVATDLLHALLDAGCVPVVSPPAFDPEHGPVNVDADRVAAAVAAALGADDLVILSNVPGLLRDPADPASVVPAIPAGRLDELLPLAAGRMKLKLIAAGEALAGGVGRVRIGDGRIRSPVRRALDGHGTLVAGGASPKVAAS